jgi:hypothetical protein
MNTVFGRVDHAANNPFSESTLTVNGAKRLLADISQLASDIAPRAAEIEAARRMPLDLVETLRSIGVFRMFVPRSYGGLELDLPTALEVIQALGRIDGSVGWTAMIASGCDLLATFLPRAIYEQVYQAGPDVILAGVGHPAGTAEAVAGGFRVNGRWPFASGCQHAGWIFGLCVMTEDGKPMPGTLRDSRAPEAITSRFAMRWFRRRISSISRAYRICRARSIKPLHKSFRCCTAPAPRAWPRALCTISSRLPIPADSSCGLRCRCGIRKPSRANSAVLPRSCEQRWHCSRSRPQAIGVTRLPAR